MKAGRGEGDVNRVLRFRNAQQSRQQWLNCIVDEGEDRQYGGHGVMAGRREVECPALASDHSNS